MKTENEKLVNKLEELVKEYYTSDPPSYGLDLYDTETKYEVRARIKKILEEDIPKMTEDYFIKLKEDNENSAQVDNLIKENQKLKTKNEELKKKYGGQISAIEQLIKDHELIVQLLQNTKTLVIDPNPELQQENNQLKQLKERVEERIKFLYKYDDIQCHEEAEKLQQLLKGVSTS